MKISKTLWELFLWGGESELLQRVPVYTGIPCHRLATIQVTNPRGGKNNLLLVGTHSKEKILRHLLLRLLLRTPTKLERELLKVLASFSNDWFFEISQFILKNELELREFNQRRSLLGQLALFPKLGLEEPRRILGSYSPRIFFFKKYVPPVKKVVIPSTMGVGYKDKGNLRPAIQINLESPEEFSSSDPSLEEFLMFLEDLQKHLLRLRLKRR